MQDEAIYRCISASCARALPRRVNFCPYCGTAQHAGAAAARPAATPPRAEPVAPVAAPIDVAWGDAGRSPAGTGGGHAAATPAAQAPAQPGASRPVHAGAAASPPRPAATPAPAPPPSAGPAPRPGATATVRPPQREPVRLRWWLVALALLWVVWLMGKPSSKKLDARIDHAISLAVECKSREAQSELIALRGTKASPEQLQRVQQALNDAAAECRRNRQRKAYSDARQDSYPLASSVDGVARPAARPSRQGTTRRHPLADGEP